MRIGIVGAGNVGRLYSQAWVQRGHDVILSYSRNPDSLAAAAASLGPRASTGEVEELVECSDVILFAPPFECIEDAASRLGAAGGKIVIDTTNPFNPARTGLVELGSATAHDHVAEALPDAVLVKAFHNLSVQQASGAMAAQPAALFVASENAAATNVVARLVIDAGLLPVATGGRETVSWSEAPGPLFMNVYDVTDAIQALNRAAE